MTAKKGAEPAAGFDCIIALGSNLGDKTSNIDRAIELLTEPGDISLVARSRNFATDPWGQHDQDWFLNACVAVKTKLAPRVLLRRCKYIFFFIDTATTEKWGPRIIDL